MFNKIKMLSGEWYEPMKSLTLSKDRSKAKDLCFEFNKIPPSKEKERQKVIKKLFNKTGRRIWVESSFYCDYGYNIEVGDNFYVNHNCVILDCAKVKFGKNVFIGPNCGFYTAIHPIEAKQRNKGIECAKPITVGDNVWIGGNVTVLPGVTIGNGAVIGAGSVVTKDIPENTVAVGNPCKPIKTIDN